MKRALLLVLLVGCAHAPKKAPPPKFGASLLFPGGGSAASGGGLTNAELRAVPVPVSGTVTAGQGTAAAGSGAWPVTVTDTANTVVKPGDSPNNAVRVNVVAGGAAGGTSSSFGAVIPATGTAAGASDGTNMQLPRVFDGDSGAGTQYVAGAILRKGASGGTVEAGTSADPLRVDPTGSTTQPVSGTVAVSGVGGTVAATQSGTWTVQPGNTANTTAWKVDGSAVIQGVSQSGGWAVTANAGTNLNTSALALDATLAQLTLTQGAATAGQKGALTLCAVSTAAPSYTTAQSSPCSLTLAGALRIDGSAVTQPVSGTVAATQSGAWSLSANQSVNVAQINGVTPLMGNGATGTGSPRVTIASDNTAFTVNVGTFPDNEPVNNAQVSGTAILVGNGVTGTGSQRVTIASDTTPFGISNVATIGTSVTPGTAAANLGKAEDAAHTTGDVGVTTLAVRNDTGTALTSNNGDYSPIAVDDTGTQFVRQGGANRWSYHENSSSALTDTTVKAACGAGLFSYIDSFTVSTGAATALNAFIEDSTTTTILGPYYLEAVAGRGFSVTYPGGKKQTNSNTLISITTSAAIAHSVDVTGFCAP